MINKPRINLAHVSKISGYSEAELQDTIDAQAARLLGESDLAWKGQSANDIIENNCHARNKLMASIHICTRTMKEISEIARERLHLMQSAHLTIARRLGITKSMSEIASDEELAQAGGYIQSNGVAVIPVEETSSEKLAPEHL